ncbi:DUF3710 domain-containing protein [Actinomyces johnsonii]|uniref:DUF3710 domain-containing protein n=1 Tax=Actinomyces johnsonii F0510 TaxID=1227262 RepID=U1RNA7_9ACTO|nr:DUF3710 domain-containing protein [Actinomyces johnsonii]ERH21138.1 hypothetical protein HMPREF1549_00798 [Actinomyces johnsonii F0510]
MGLFSRRRDDASTETDEPALDSDDGSSESTASGPWDLHELPEDQEEVPRIDLGSLRIPAVDGMQLRMEQGPEGTITAVVLALGGSALELRVFAAPRTAGIWDELRGDIADELAGSGARYEESYGEHGTELVAHLPMRGPDGKTTTGTIRFLGIDGPRWFLRGVLQGHAASSEQSAQALREVLRGIVVVRDGQARPPREILPLHAPGAAAGPEAEDLPGIDPLAPGPTIAEVR